MKKIILLAAALFSISLFATAQPIAIGGSFTNNAAPVFYTSLDTVIDVGTKTYTAAIPNRWQSITLQVNMLKISGTTSAVTVKFYGAVSIAGSINYVLLYTDTMANASTNVSHVIVGSPYTHYKMDVAGSGTQQSSYQAFILLK